MGGARGAGGPELELRLLGPLEVLKRGVPVALGGPKPRALLAVLALELGRVVSVDRLVEDLWPGTPPQTAAHAVQVYVSQLRKALGDVLARQGPGYSLALEPNCVDFHRFTRLTDEGQEELQAGNAAAAAGTLREALALWRGPALADFVYEPFAQADIARLEELRTVALEERIEADLALGRHAELVSELEALVETQPMRERPRAQLMLALYRTGRQADALAAYRETRETLVEELGIEPGPQLKGLEAAILRQDESLLLSGEAAARPAMQFRRLVTILFADVVDSMALAEALDPEALGEVLRRYFETVSAVLSRHGGTVEKFAGDAVMAAFGIPVSHEDDALRAARAALDIQAALAALNEQVSHEHGVKLDVSIGIETGEVLAAQTDARQRLVTGEAVGVAARLEQSAETGEIVVGEVTGRLIDHAARLEPLGELEIKGRSRPVRAFRLLELAPVSRALERRLDAPLTGRRKELGALKKALRSALAEQRARIVTVIGPPGIGKSRLAAEIARRAKDATSLAGRCLSYGEGITYWPLREVVEEAAGGEERDAVVAALEAGTPPPAPEIAWAFRRFCEAVARERPLVLVFDDLHWAEPTFLELLEHLADKGEGPILVICVAREELLEDHPDFLAGRANAERIVLDSLSADETDALLEGLGGAVLETDQRARIVETAEGNPLFLEQLLALALEGGLAERPLPETVQALLAARLDRLGPGERAVLERGAVVGKEFTDEDVVALLEPGTAPTADAHLRTLAGRGFVRPRGDGAFSFRHILVQEAVYRAAPKRLRAELHERFADRLAGIAEEIAEPDEFVGYHLEQAYRLRTELGESDRRTARLAEDGGRRLGEAGVRALKRGDMPATVNLLGRATSLLRGVEPLRSELLWELGSALRTTGESDAAERALEESVQAAREAGDRRIELLAEIEQAYMGILQSVEGAADRLLKLAGDAIPLLETIGDDRSLGWTWLLVGFVQGGHRGNHAAWEIAAARALSHYKRCGWQTSTSLGEIAAALYYGPTPVPEAIARCKQLLADEVVSRAGEANVLTFLGGLVAQRGEFDNARERVATARTIYDDLGQKTVAATYCGALLGDIELLAGEFATAETVLNDLCTALQRLEAFSHLSSRASDLAEALYAQGRLGEAEHWAAIAEKHSANDDVSAQVLWRLARAKIMARRGEVGVAEKLAREAARLSESSDWLNGRAKAQRDLAEVLLLAGEVDDAASALGHALELYEQKGNAVEAARARALHEELVLV